jgi:hypothetical protein
LTVTSVFRYLLQPRRSRGKKPAEVNAVIDSTAKTMTVTLDAGSHTITKQDTCNLFGIKLVPITE